jgi:hypothetical protein
MTSGLATLVAGIWTEAGYETTISHRDGETYVLAEHAAGRYDLLWVLDPGAELTAEGVERYRSRTTDLDVADAYAVTATEIGAESRERTERHGIHPVGVETLRSLAAESGVGQDAVDAALATTVGPEQETPEDDAADPPAAVPDEREASDESVPLDDPDQQATVRQRLAVMIGEAEPDEDSEAEATDGTESDAGDAGGPEAGVDDAAADGDSDSAADRPVSDDGDDSEDEAAESTGGSGEASGGGEGSDPLGDPELPDDPDAAGGGTGGKGPLRSRRGLITGGVAAVLSAGVLDFTVLNLVLGGGGGGLPAYNETRVKAEAARYTPQAIMADPSGFAAQEVAVVFEDAVVTDVTDDGGLARVTFDAGGTVVGRWDGDDPTIGTRYTVWAVVTGTTTAAEEDVPAVDIVDMTTGGGGTRGGTTGTAAGTATGTASETADSGG